MRTVVGRLQAIHWNQVSTLTLVTLLVLSGTVATVGVAPAAATTSGGLAGQATDGSDDSRTLASANGAFTLGSLLQTDDWPTAGRDPGRSGHSPNGSGPTIGPEARWIHEFEDDDVDIPAVTADGLVFVPGENSVRAVDADTGELVWNVTESGIGSVTASQGLVITTATDYSDGDWIRAYHATNGTEAWNVSNFEADTSVAFDGVYYATRGEYLYAYDLQTGEQLWYADVNEDVTGSLSAADGTIYATGEVNNRDRAVYALNASDGTEQWRFEVEGELSMDPTAVDGSVFVGAGDEDYDPKFYRLDATDGHVEWIFDVNTEPRGAAVADGLVYLAAGNTVHALDEETGQREWLHRLAGSIEYGLHYHGMHARSPAVADGTVYAVNDRGFLVGLDGATGAELWEYRLEGWAMAPAVADGRIYVHVTDTEDTNTDYSRVYALEDAPFEFTGLLPSTTSVDPGEEMTVDVTVENVDDETRAYDLSLVGDAPFPSDQWTLARENGSLAPGETTTLTFTAELHGAAAWNLSVQRLLETEPAAGPVTVDVGYSQPVDEWSMGGFDANRSDANPATDGPSRHLQERWNVSYFDEDTTPVVSDGSVYLIRHQNRYGGPPDVHAVTAYEEESGAVQWEYNFTAENRVPTGSAAVANDTVYVVTRPFEFDDGFGSTDDGSVYAIDSGTGTKVWERAVDIDVGTPDDHGPIVTDGRVYLAGAIHDENTNYENGSVVALDADDGSIVWSHTMGDRGLHQSYVTYAAGEGHVFATNQDQLSISEYEDELHAFDASSGTVQWTTDSLGLDVELGTTPVVAGGLVFVVDEVHDGDGDLAEELVALNVSTGNEQWRFSPPNVPGYDSWRLRKPAVSDGSLYVRQTATTHTDSNRLHRVDVETGVASWNTSTRYLSRIQVVDGVVYGAETSFDPGYTRVFDAETGELLGHTDKGLSLAVANGTSYAYDDWNQVLRALGEGGVIEYTDLSVDTHTLGEGENVTVTATATNVGAYTHRYDVDLDVAPDNHGDRHFWNYANREGILTPGESTTITWKVRLDVRDDYVFFLAPQDGGDSLDRFMYVRTGTETVHVGDADDGTVFDLGGPRDLAPDAASWPKESFDAGNTGNYTGTGAPTAVGDDVVTWIANHSSAWGSGPTLAEDTIFAGGYGGNGDALFAFNATDGSLRWEYPTESDVEVAPTYAGGYLYTADRSGRVYQFDATTSERLWTYQEVEDVGGITVVGNVVYVAGDVYVDDGYSGTVHALNATTREVLWTFTRASSSYGMEATPAVENGTVYVASDDGYTYALNATTGAIEWSEPIAGSGSRLHSPVVEDGVVYVDDSTDANLYALDATDGSTIWSIPANVDGSIGSSPALADGTLYFTADSAVRAVDATDGSELWSTTICSAARHSPVHAGGVVYVGTTDSAIRAYDADTGDLVWRYDGYDEYTFTPAVVGGVLYATGLENEDYTHSLLAVEGGTTDEPKTLFDYYGLSVSNEAVAVGEPITVSATIRNQGDAACDYAADLVIDGTVEDTATGSLGSDSYNDDETVEFTHSFASVGTYNVTIEDLPPLEVTVSAPSPGISANPSAVEYGDVEVGDTHGTIDVLIENDGTEPLDVSSRSITGPDAGDFGFSYAGPNSPIAPGDSSWVGVWFAPSHTGAHTATIELENNATGGAFEIPLSGTGIVDPPAIQVTPTTVDFGDVTAGTTANETVTIENVGGSTLTFDDATLGTSELDSFEIVAGNVTTALAPGEAHDLTIAFAPPIASADSTSLEIDSDDPANATVSVALEGTGVDPTPPPSGNGGGSGGSSGGGGGGGATPAPPADDEPADPPAPSISLTALDDGGFAITVANADGDETLTARFPNGSLGSDGLSLDALGITLVDAASGDLQVTAGSEAPAGTAPPDASVGESLAYFDVAHPSLAEGDVTGATFEFTVPRELLEDRGVAPEDVVLVRHHGGEWTVLETRLIDETAETYVFEASSPGLSVFAVVASTPEPSAPGDDTDGEPADPDDQEPTDPGDSADGEQADQEDADGSDSGGSGGQPGFGPLAALVALLTAVGSLSRRRQADGGR